MGLQVLVQVAVAVEALAADVTRVGQVSLCQWNVGVSMQTQVVLVTEDSATCLTGEVLGLVDLLMRPQSVPRREALSTGLA